MEEFKTDGIRGKNLQRHLKRSIIIWVSQQTSTQLVNKGDIVNNIQYTKYIVVINTNLANKTSHEIIMCYIFPC